MATLNIYTFFTHGDVVSVRAGGELVVNIYDFIYDNLSIAK